MNDTNLTSDDLTAAFRDHARRTGSRSLILDAKPSNVPNITTAGPTTTATDHPAAPGRIARVRSRWANHRAARRAKKYERLTRQAANRRNPLPVATQPKALPMTRHRGHFLTGENAAALRLDDYEPAVSPAGPFIGTEDRTGRALRLDPFHSYQQGVNSPNWFVSAKQGYGKSLMMKMYGSRQVDRGRRLLVIDGKSTNGNGEWATYAKAHNWTVVTFGPGSDTRINLLDRRLSSKTANAQDLDQATLLRSVGETALGRSLTPVEGRGLTYATRALQQDYRTRQAAHQAAGLPGNADEPILEDLANRILHPDEAAAASVNMTVPEMTAAVRDLAVTLLQLIDTDGGDTLNGQTNLDVDLDAAAIIMDVSKVPLDSKLRAIVMTIVMTFVHTAWWKDDGRKHILMMDEASMLLDDLGSARALRASEKTSRGKAMQHIIAVQQITNITATRTDDDLRAAVTGVIDEAETVLIGRQDANQAVALSEHRLLNAETLDAVQRLGTGDFVALIGTRAPIKFHTTPTPGEKRRMNSDAAMKERR